ncbi:MAG TPA: NADH-quinone oxidoreductase subunit K [Acidimicrobiales bacterium]
MTILLALTAALLFGIGTYLVLQHTLSRILIGLALLSHGANVLLMGSGRRGTPPLIGAGDPDGFADPLAQAFALTAIVISFGVSALLLALSYRSWILTGKDEVEDDVADRAIASGGHHDKEITDEEEWHEEDRLNLDATPEDDEVAGPS